MMVGHVTVGKAVGVRFFRQHATACRSAPVTAQTANNQQQDYDENASHQADDDGQRFFHADSTTQDAFATTALQTVRLKGYKYAVQ